MNTMRRCQVLALLMILTFQLKSQTEYFDIPFEEGKEQSIPRLAIKLVPSQLIWRYPSYAIAIEHSLKSNVSLEYEFGLIQKRDVFDDDATYFANKSGFKSSVLLKSYSSNNNGLFDLSGLSRYNASILPFFGLEVFYNNLRFDRTRTFRINCGDDCDFFQNTTFGIRNSQIGARANLGLLMEFFGPLKFEFSLAFGFAYEHYSPDERKPAQFDRVFGRDYKEDFEGVVPALDLAIKLVFIVK